MIGLSEETASWFVERFGEPTPPQSRGWPEIAAGRDTLIAAPTGSGKTLAAFLYCLDGLLRRARAGALEDKTYVLYVSPLKALSHDIQVNLEGPLAELQARMGVTGIRTAVRTGDTTAAERQRAAAHPPHVLVTTPESLYILLTTKRGRAGLAGVETVIVDEIHALVPDRRGAHLALSLARLDALAGRRAQRIGLSATQKPLELVGRYLTGGAVPAIVDAGHARALDVDILAPGGELGAVMTHEQWADIYDAIARLTADHRTTIVFTNTRRLAERIAHHLTARLGEGQVAAHHGALSRTIRLDAERRLRDGSLKVIVATASLELGIDVGAVDLVVQIGTPRAIATLLQRVGRAGHARRATPKGRLVATTRDDLVECAALVRAMRAGQLDALSVPDAPLDVLAQQVVAACVSDEWVEDDLYALCRGAFPYRELTRERFDQVLEMLGEGIAARRGRTGAYLHRDRVNGRVRARRNARLAAILSGGAIPDRADYEVVCDPEGVRVGTLDEDFAIESSAGDIFLLGNTSWRIRRVEAGRVRVEDARGQPPTIPFWFGEGPSRTEELSAELSRLRADVGARLDDRAAAAAWVAESCRLDPGLAGQLVDYLWAGKRALGVLPTQDVVVAERFFDEGGGMQLVIHAPFGARINRAWGLALRKKFCRSFNFELQAAATDDGIVISLGDQHSFPLDMVASFVPERGVRETLTQAALQGPHFETRWRWVSTRSLAVLRMTSRGKVPAPIQRIRVADLLAAVFPQQAACQDNVVGDIEPPDHPLVIQTLRDCLDEAMNTAGLVRVLAGLADGTIAFVARDTPEPSPLSHALLNANPYAYLDDAPLEERRARAVSVRRSLPADVAAEVGGLDPEAIRTVKAEAMPPVRDADELHDLLCLAGAWPVAPEHADLFARLAASRRATRLGDLWVAAERLASARAIWGDLPLAPPIDAIGAAVEREAAVLAVVRGRLEVSGPETAAALAAALRLDPADVTVACLQLEAQGLVLRGQFTPGGTELEWCDRRLLLRIHRLTLGRLRREIEPVAPADLLRFLARWQRTAPGTQLHGEAGLAVVLDQLQGFEAPIAAWEAEILPQRIGGYDPAWLDALCLSGDFMWGRRGDSDAEITTRATPVAFWRREAAPWMVTPRSEGDTPVEKILAERGALFYGELLDATGMTRVALDEVLWALVAAGRATADGFAALRALGTEDIGRRARKGGRWALLRAEACAPDVAADKHARTLLRRYGVVLRELSSREVLPPWRDLLQHMRRMEARGEIRGGRFVAGFVGEQFALPEAIEALRASRRAEPFVVAPPKRDPLYVRALVSTADTVAATGGASPA